MTERTPEFFTPEQRDLVRGWLVDRAKADERIPSGAFAGSSARGEDPWSDVDLTFAVDERYAIADVLTQWTRDFVERFDAAILFDLPFRSSIYRVFLLPGALQVDLSFTPASDFGSHGPRFRLLFGEAVDHPQPQAQTIEHRLGLAIHHCVRALVCIERHRLWQAEYWIHEARDEALAIACARMDLEQSHGRGFDRLPAEVRADFARSFVSEITVPELRRTSATIAALLLPQSHDLGPAYTTVVRALRLVVESSQRASAGPSRSSRP